MHTLLVGVQEVFESLDAGLERVVVSVTDLVHTVQKLHVVDFAWLVFVHEPHESVDVFLTDLTTDYFLERNFEPYRLHLSIVLGVCVFEELL